MERVIYCPSYEDIDKTAELVQKTKLPVQIGHSDKTKNIVFDESLVQVIEIPSIEELFSFGEVKQFFHQCIIYINEFLVLKNNIKLYIDDNEIKSMFEEKHRVKYSFYCDKKGIRSCKIVHLGTTLKEFDFVVN